MTNQLDEEALRKAFAILRRALWKTKGMSLMDLAKGFEDYHIEVVRQEVAKALEAQKQEFKQVLEGLRIVLYEEPFGEIMKDNYTGFNRAGVGVNAKIDKALEGLG